MLNVEEMNPVLIFGLYVYL